MNKYVYHVYKTDQASLSECMANGFSGGNTSTDGLLCLVDKKGFTRLPISDPPSKPSYVEEEMPNFPYLNYEEAKALISYQATSNGASDGWWYDRKL